MISPDAKGEGNQHDEDQRGRPYEPNKANVGNAPIAPEVPSVFEVVPVEILEVVHAKDADPKRPTEAKVRQEPLHASQNVPSPTP